MKSDSLNQLQLRYEGSEFLLDVAEGNLVNLNTLHEIANGSKSQSPRLWRTLSESKKLIEALSCRLNVGKPYIIKSARGKGGGTFAHWQLALAYAKYLSPAFHLVVNDVFKERLEETVDPELGIQRSRDRAINIWQRQDKPQEWIEDRLKGIQNRNHFTTTLKTHSVNGSGYGWCTNAIYRPIMGGSADEIRKERRLPSKGNVRDAANRVELAAISLAEAIASESIKDKDYQGNRLCALASGKAGQSVKLALDHAKESP